MDAKQLQEEEKSSRPPKQGPILQWINDHRIKYKKMSDSSITIVPKIAVYPEKIAKANEILNWLVSLDIFSDLGFIFWNWLPFTENFLNEFKQKLE